MIRRYIAGVALALAVSGCSTLGALSTVASVVSPDKPEITAQVGAENNKQGLGIQSKVSSEEKTSIGDIKADTAVVTQTKTNKPQQIETGTVTARVVNIKSSDPSSLLFSFGLSLVAILGLVVWLWPTKKEEQNA